MQIFSFRRARKSFGISRWLILAAAIFAFAAASSTASAQVVVSVSVAPPVLPVYTQPICPAPGYIWTPATGPTPMTADITGFPARGSNRPKSAFSGRPAIGVGTTARTWNAGYWGPEVGFYGGINYGFGYTGFGYEGGYWRDRNFYYNSRVNNVNVTVVHNVYEKNVVVHDSHVSYNGGRGGISARPSAAQEKFAHEHHVGPTSAQEQHISAARSDRSQFASANHGHPKVAATAKPGDFHGAHVVPAKASASERLNSSRTESKSRRKPRAKPRRAPNLAPRHPANRKQKPSHARNRSLRLHTNRSPKPRRARNLDRPQRTSRKPKPSRDRIKAINHSRIKARSGAAY